MKKYLVLLGAALLVMAVASPSMAQFKSWGHMEIATMWIEKQDFNTGGYNADGTAKAPDKDANYRRIAERFRFYLQYGDPKTVRAVIGFEADSNNWGESRQGGPSETYQYSLSNTMGVYGTDQAVLEIKHAFIEFVVPHTPLTLTAGLQWFGYGGRLFQSKDAPGLTLTANFAPHKIQAFWWRERDDAYLTYNVNDTYGLSWAMTQKLFNVGAFFAYKNDLYTGHNPSVKLTAQTTAVGPYTPTTPGATASTYIPVFYSTPVASEYDDHPWWLGVNAGFRPGNWDFSANFIYNGGKRDYVTGTDPDYKGWIADASASYKIGPGMSATLEGFYSTGNDTGSTDYKAYTYASGSEAAYSFGNDRFIFSFMNADFMYYAGKQLNPVGMYYLRANFEYNPVPWVNLNFNYIYLGDTSKGTGGAGIVNGDPAGSAANMRQDKDEDYVGSELNVIAKIKIYESLYYNIGFAYFMAGDVYDASNKSADDAYSLLTCLRYFF